MVDIVLYSILEFASGFAPNLTALLILRALYGIAMGGEWGVGASLTMETHSAACARLRLGPAAVGLSDRLFPRLDRLRRAVPLHRLARHVHGRRRPGAARPLHPPHTCRSRRAGASRRRVERGSTLTVLQSHWRLGIYAVVLMTAFNFFSHGTQDLYPTFLQVQHKLSPHAVGIIAVIYNIGAICGGIFFGALSERFGRRMHRHRGAVCRLPIIPLWAFSTSRCPARGRRLPDAVRGAGRVGHRAGAPERTVARHGARARFPASSTSSAICSPRSTRRCRPASPRISAAIMGSRSPLSPALSRSSSRLSRRWGPRQKVSLLPGLRRRSDDRSYLDLPSHWAVYVTRISVTSNPLPPGSSWANATELNEYGY